MQAQGPDWPGLANKKLGPRLVNTNFLLHFHLSLKFLKLLDTTVYGEISIMERMGHRILKESSKFTRYFYLNLPKAYHITQQMKQYVLKSFFSIFWRFTNLYIYIYIYIYNIHTHIYCCAWYFSVLEWLSLSNNGQIFTNPINSAMEL